jgi:hypothetical protein
LKYTTCTDTLPLSDTPWEFIGCVCDVVSCLGGGRRAPEDYQDELDGRDGTSTYFLIESICKKHLNTYSHLKIKPETFCWPLLPSAITFLCWECQGAPKPACALDNPISDREHLQETSQYLLASKDQARDVPQLLDFGFILLTVHWSKAGKIVNEQ